MAARGKRLVLGGRLCVALSAAAVAAFGSVQSAHAQEPSPTPAAETASSEPPPGDAAPPPPPPSDPEPSPPPTPEPPPSEPPADADPVPPSDSGDSTPPDSAPASTDEAAAADPPPADDSVAGPVVTLEDAPAPPAASAEPPPASTQASAPAAAPAAPVPAPAAAAITIVLVAEAPAADQGVVVTVADQAADNASAADDTAPAVSFASDDESSPVELLDHDAAAPPARRATAARAAATARVPATGSIQPTCARPRARVPLSQRCKQARASGVLGVTFVSAPSPAVRAAINRIAQRVTARRVESRAPPDSKAAKKRPDVNVRPIVPSQYPGHGASNDSFGGSGGSVSSSRLFALAAVPLHVPKPSRFIQLRTPSTIAHGVVAAPPTARPG